MNIHNSLKRAWQGVGIYRVSNFLLPMLVWTVVPQSLAAPPQNHLLVESPVSRDVQVIDVGTRKVIRNIAIGEFTDDVMGSPDGSVFYVGAQDDARSPFGHQINESGKVMALTHATRTSNYRIGSKRAPHRF